MDALGWLVAYVVGFAFVQLLLYRYVQRDDASPDAAPGSVDRSARRTMERPSTPSDDEEEADGVTCRHCGAVNEYEQPFTYCERCVRPLQ